MRPCVVCGLTAPHPGTSCVLRGTHPEYPSDDALVFSVVVGDPNETRQSPETSELLTLREIAKRWPRAPKDKLRRVLPGGLVWWGRGKTTVTCQLVDDDTDDE